MRKFFREFFIYLINFILVIFLASQLFSLEKIPKISKKEEIKVAEEKIEVIEPPKKEIVKEKKEEETYTQVIYEVKVGETIIGVAQRYSIDWKELAKVNNLKDPNKLYVGQKLIIPVKKD